MDLQGKCLAPTVPRRSLDIERMLTANKGLLEPAHITMDAAEVSKTAGFMPVIVERAARRPASLADPPCLDPLRNLGTYCPRSKILC